VDLTMVIIAINSWNRLAIAFRAIAGTYMLATQHTAECKPTAQHSAEWDAINDSVEAWL